MASNPTARAPKMMPLEAFHWVTDIISSRSFTLTPSTLTSSFTLGYVLHGEAYGFSDDAIFLNFLSLFLS